MNKKTFPVRDFGTIQDPIELPQIVFPTGGQQAGDRSSFVQEEPPGLRCPTKIWATGVVEDVFIYLGTLIW